MNWYLAVLKNYVGFSGRARRKEYWMFVLFNIIAAIVLGILDGVLGTRIVTGAVDAFGKPQAVGILGSLYGLAIFVPSLAVLWRRLHDTSRSGWWFLLALIPCVGVFVLLVFLVLPGTPGPNQYGADPKTLPDPS